MGNKTWVAAGLQGKAYLPSDLPRFEHEVVWLVQWLDNDGAVGEEWQLRRVQARSPEGAFFKFMEGVGFGRLHTSAELINIILPNPETLRRDLGKFVALREKLNKERKKSFHSHSDIVAVLRGEDVELPAQKANWNEDDETEWKTLGAHISVIQDTLREIENETTQQESNV